MAQNPVPYYKPFVPPTNRKTWSFIVHTYVTRNNFHLTFRAIRPDNFTSEGLDILFDYLEEYEDATGVPLEFDVVGLCCEFYEDSPREIADSYRINISDCEDDDDVAQRVQEYLEDEGVFVGAGDNIIVFRQF